MKSLANQIVFITGASSGIGRSCARLFAEAGAKLLLVARRKDRLEQLAAELKKKYNTETYIASLDVRNRNAVEQFCSSLPSEWNAVDILVNNAGLSRGLDKLHEGTIEDWEEMIDTNVKGLLYVSRTDNSRNGTTETRNHYQHRFYCRARCLSGGQCGPRNEACCKCINTRYAYGFGRYAGTCLHC